MRDESHIIIGGLPLDLYDAMVARQIREREYRKLREVCLWVIAIAIMLGLCAFGIPMLAGQVPDGITIQQVRP